MRHVANALLLLVVLFVSATIPPTFIRALSAHSIVVECVVLVVCIGITAALFLGDENRW